MLKLFLFGLFLSGFTILSAPSLEASGTSGEAQISCLQEPKRLTPESMINWSVVRSRKALEKCAFEVAQQFADLDSLAVWFENNGFKTSPPRVIAAHVMETVYGTREVGGSFSASQSRDDIRIRLGFIDRFLVHSMSVGIYTDAAGLPVKVSVVLTRE